MSPNDMTVDGCRHWIKKRSGSDLFLPCTLGGASLALPPGWIWERVGLSQEEGGGMRWYAWKPYVGDVDIRDTGDETLDRFRLAVACCMAEDKAEKEAA